MPDSIAHSLPKARMIFCQRLLKMIGRLRHAITVYSPTETCAQSQSPLFKVPAELRTEI